MLDISSDGNVKYDQPVDNKNVYSASSLTRLIKKSPLEENSTSYITFPKRKQTEISTVSLQTDIRILDTNVVIPGFNETDFLL